MPKVSQFFGISIYFFYDDHPPPHFHVRYGQDVAAIEIDTLTVRAGWLPPRVLGLVMEWAALHQEELRTGWMEAENHLPLSQIPPLR